jgi:hypothetical protein
VGRDYLSGSVKNMTKKGSTCDGMENFGVSRAHSGALASGENDHSGGGHQGLPGSLALTL